MADNIQDRDVQVGLTVAWHRKTIVESVITKENSRICYPMVKQPLFLPDGTKTDFSAIVSLDDGKAIGNPVSTGSAEEKGYKLISNEQIFEMVSNALAGTGYKLVSCGSVANRSKVFITVQPDNAITAANRETITYLNILWGHGGVFGILAKAGFTVVVCENTFNMALNEKSEFKLSMKHCGNAVLKLENLGRAIESHYGVIAEFKAAMDQFANVPCAESKAERIVTGFLQRETEAMSTRGENTVKRIVQLYKGGAGNRGENMADLFNGVTDYFSHESSGGNDTFKQFESSEFGGGNNRKGEMFALLRGSTVPKLGDLATVENRGDKVLLLTAQAN